GFAWHNDTFVLTPLFSTSIVPPPVSVPPCRSCHQDHRSVEAGRTNSACRGGTQRTLAWRDKRTCWTVTRMPRATKRTADLRWLRHRNLVRWPYDSENV